MTNRDLATQAAPSKVISRRRGMAFFAAGLLAACTPEINHRGYYAKPGALEQVREGMSKTEVESVMGSPTTTASINFQGDSYYYITSITQGRAFLAPVEVKREIIAIRFDRDDAVTSVATYGLEDGRIINIVTRKTPTVGQEFSILKELFGGASRGTGPSTGNLQRRF